MAASRPISGSFAKVSVDGLRWVVTSRESFNSVRLGLEVGPALQKLYPGKISFSENWKLIGGRATIRALEVGDDSRGIDPIRTFCLYGKKMLTVAVTLVNTLLFYSLWTA